MKGQIKCYFVVYNTEKSKINYKIISTYDKNIIFRNYPVICFFSIPKEFLKISNQQIIVFFTYLQFQINNGVSLKNAVEAFINTSSDFRLLFYAKPILEKLNSGLSFADSVVDLIDYNGFNLVKNLETTGNIESILLYLIDYYKLKSDLYTSIFRKLRMPFISFFFIIILMGGIISYMAPVVSEITKNNSVTDFVTFYYGFVICIMMYYLIINTIGRRFIFFDPIIGNIILKVNLWVFSHNLNLCLKAKLHLLKSISISALSTPNITIKNLMVAKTSKIYNGSSFYNSIKDEKIFSGIFSDAVMIGEKNNSIQQTMENFSLKIYNDLLFDLDKLSSNLSIFLNVFSGIILATILLNVIGPIYELVEKIDCM